MEKLFFGFLLTFLDFNLDLGASRIGLIPDFVGYIFLRNGLREMAEESPRFIRIRPFVTFMAFYTGTCYWMDLVGLSASLGALAIIPGLVSLALFLYISYTIVLGVQDMEVSYHMSFGGHTLMTAWTVAAVCQVLTFVLLFIPLLALISLITAFVAGIWFLVLFYQAKNAYADRSLRR